VEPTTLTPDVTASTEFILNITSTPSRPTVGELFFFYYLLIASGDSKLAKGGQIDL
jgi:hypothetical protein